jgi:hypothetical protein
VHGAEVLPFRRAHLGTVLRGARWGVREEAHYQSICSLHQQSAQLIEPQGAVDTVGRRSEQGGALAIDGHGGVVFAVGRAARCLEIEGFEVLLELEGGVKLDE